MNLNKYHSTGRLYTAQEYTERAKALLSPANYNEVLHRIGKAVNRPSLLDKLLGSRMRTAMRRGK